ncbi:PepSY domain-containing protein [Trichococcus collinsii]|uniref:Uncharacterized membrane protein YkoI n=1 Tax=Trichococcus collinsii TaxID=157076 RepID=A0AB38A105_9LACT|nr:PepSY domain-containing protein [Trichococcus collinsii]CZQ91822.1 Hypothetical protein Tcol_1142 [Trichococcus collinsii]SEA56121.1 Uncharacterized membrane protein YkoI [Trichococcus collinsii]
MMQNWKYVALSGLAVLTLAGCGDNANTSEDISSTSSSMAQEASTETMDPANISSTAVTTDAALPAEAGYSSVSLDRAVAIFIEKYPDARIKEVDFDKDFGDYTYEIKGVVGQTEYELRIHSETEEILKEESENNDSDDDVYLSFGNLISPVEAIRIAQDRISTDASDFEGWKLDSKDDHGNAPVYEVEFQGHDAEVKIHAETGEVLGVDG